MTRQRRPYISLSDAQANALAVARRDTPHSAEHERTWQERFGGRNADTMPMRDLVEALHTAYAEEVPIRLHEGFQHIGEGGVPAMTNAFVSYLSSSAGATKGDESPIESTYQKPVQAMLEGMGRSTGKVAWWGKIAARVIISAEVPIEAAIAEGSHQYEATRTASEALAEAYRRLSPTRIALPSRRLA